MCSHHFESVVRHSHAEILEQRAAQIVALHLSRDDDAVEVYHPVTFDFKADATDQPIKTIDNDNKLVVLGHRLGIALT